MLKDHLTNEEVRKKFKSLFELVNYSIALAENMIKSGRGPRVKTDVQNRALHILEEIVTGKDQFDEIAEPVEVALMGQETGEDSRKKSEHGHRNAGHKKERKIFAE